MHILQGTKHLIKKKLVMLLSQVIVSFDDLVQIRLHELKHDVNVFELSFRRRKHDAFDLDYIRMPQETEKLDLAEDAERVGDVFEDVIDLLYRYFLSRVGVDGRAHDSVASFPDHFEDLVTVRVAVLGEKVHLFHVLYGSRIQENTTRSHRKEDTLRK